MLQGQGVIAQVAKTINLSEIVENSSSSSRRQPLRAAPRYCLALLKLTQLSADSLAAPAAWVSVLSC